MSVRINAEKWLSYLVKTIFSRDKWEKERGHRAWCPLDKTHCRPIWLDGYDKCTGRDYCLKFVRLEELNDHTNG